MKSIVFKSILSCSVLLLCCWNGTLIDSKNKSKLPDVNFYGTIEDQTKTFNFQYLLIDKRYCDIPVYPYSSLKKLKKQIDENSKDTTNAKETIDPTQNKALLKLDEIKTIELLHPSHPVASIIEINKKEYIEIIVTAITGTKTNYLIESTRKITCKEIDKNSIDSKDPVLIDRELHMIHIKKLTIDGYKSVPESEEKKITKDTKEVLKESAEKKEVTSNTEKILNQIEENVKNLSQENPSTLEKIKHSIISLLKSLREQLQKMLHMLS